MGFFGDIEKGFKKATKSVGTFFERPTTQVALVKGGAAAGTALVPALKPVFAGAAEFGSSAIVAEAQAREEKKARRRPAQTSRLRGPAEAFFPANILQVRKGGGLETRTASIPSQGFRSFQGQAVGFGTQGGINATTLAVGGAVVLGGVVLFMMVRR